MDNRSTLSSEHDRIYSPEDPTSPLLPPSTLSKGEDKNTRWSGGRWRRPLGLLLLFFTVILWTTSNFLASTLFADNTFSKPYMVTYINTAFFVVPLFPIIIRQALRDPESLYACVRIFRRRMVQYKSVAQEDLPTTKPDSPGVYTRPHAQQTSSTTPQELYFDESPETSQISSSHSSASSASLTLAETARLSIEFCILWFLANYFVAACLEYTTVASSTILTSTSSVFTLLFGTLFRVEIFTLRKLAGVVASLAGIALISSVDLSGSSDKNRGTFPHKTVAEIAIGDGMALISAVMYGVYAVFMKKRIGDESRIDMPVFFGLVGLFNMLLLWPGFLILHFTDLERFELPPNSRIWTIILFNSASSLISDFAWAYAVLLTSPIVVTVGLSTTIPISLVVQMLLNDQTASAVYWLGACVVVLSFFIVSFEGAEVVQDGHVVTVASARASVDGVALDA